MPDKSLLLRTFNSQFFAFLDDIITIIPDEEIIKSKAYFETNKTLNPSLLNKIWFSYIESNYHHEILAGNIDFFLEKDYEADLVNLPNAKQIVNTIDTSLREPLKKMDATNRDHCKDHIILLSKLSRAYNDA